jgi:maltooligosyltrehalose trehalohydrolase
MSAAPALDDPPGAVLRPDGTCTFAVWAPRRQRVDVVFTERGTAVPMVRGSDDVFRAEVAGVAPGTRYVFRLDGSLERPDPASRFQPDGMHAPSAVVARRSPAPGFLCPSVDSLVLYELHVGTFTAAGTLPAAIARLDHLVQLGVNAVELMPVAQFPGGRNWGYDGVYAFAVQASYGGPDGLAEFVAACHERGIAVILDVVYNHVGPEGNYLADFGPYFNERYATPWGPAMNFDDRGSDAVRWHFIAAACYFLDELGVDGFRIDAVHAILDTSAQPFLQQLTSTLHARAARRGRRALLIAESDLNDARMLLPAELGGNGMDAQWSDDFHHSLHTMLTGERQGYYQDFGDLRDLATAYRDGWTYGGRWSRHRGRRHGNSPRLLQPGRFVVYAQTHDQVGNRARGDRLSSQLTFAQQKLAAAAVLLSPFVPMLFMGEEFGETAPFQYFTSHGTAELQEAVRKGRMAEFAAFGWEPHQVPDPQDPATFARSRLDWTAPEREPHRTLLALHRELIALRRHPALQQPDKAAIEVEVHGAERVLVVRRRHEHHVAALVLCFAAEQIELRLALPAGIWHARFDSEDRRFRGRGSTVAGELSSDGSTSLVLAPSSALLLTLERA